MKENQSSGQLDDQGNADNGVNNQDELLNKKKIKL